MLKTITHKLKLNTTQLRALTALLFILLLALLGTKKDHKEVPTFRALSSHNMSLDTRYSNEYVNNVFKDNILLSMAYLRGAKALGGPLDWNAVEKPFAYTFTLQPGQSFAFHDDAIASYKSSVVKTTEAHFNTTEGFKSDGFLVGDGVCHLASLIYWSAKDAKLDTLAPTNHDFAHIPEIPREYGVAIYNDPMNKAANEQQNLYVKNNHIVPVAFTFTYNGHNLTVAISELITPQRALALNK